MQLSGVEPEATNKLGQRAEGLLDNSDQTVIEDYLYKDFDGGLIPENMKGKVNSNLHACKPFVPSALKLHAANRIAFVPSGAKPHRGRWGLVNQKRSDETMFRLKSILVKYPLDIAVEAKIRT